MKFSLVAAGVGCLALAAGCQCSDSGDRPAGPYAGAVEEGFVSLFNGTDLTGWTGDTAIYGVDPKEPGVLQCFPDRKSNGNHGNLITEKEYENFVLRF